MKTNFVKIHLFLFGLCLVFFSMGCKKLNIEKECRIDIGAYFEKDFVIIKLDDEIIFSDSVNTSALLGVAEILKIEYPIGKYEISVNVNGIEKVERFRHKDNCFIYISFDNTSSEIKITFPSERYIYD